jgi:hypothetical protein
MTGSKNPPRNAERAVDPGPRNFLNPPPFIHRRFIRANSDNLLLIVMLNTRCTLSAGAQKQLVFFLNAGRGWHVRVSLIKTERTGTDTQ